MSKVSVSGSTCPRALFGRGSGDTTVRRVETACVAVQVEASVHVRSDVATDAFRHKIHFDDLLMFVIVVV